MGLFDAIIGSISDPNQKTQSSDLAGMLQGIQALAGQQGTSEGSMQQVISALGNHVKTGLNQVHADESPETADLMVEQLSAQGQASPDMLERLFGGQGGQQQVAEDVSKKSGIDPQMIMSLLPVVLPIIMNLLKSGGPAGGGSQAAATTPQSGGSSMNPILQSFLDSDKDGDVDLGDVIKMAGPFLSGK